MMGPTGPGAQAGHQGSYRTFELQVRNTHS